MVFDQSQTHFSSEENDKFKLASVQDRFLAFVFDVLIFSPIFSFILSQVFKNIELMYYTAPSSYEFLTLVAVCVLMSAILAVLFQTMFLLLFGATPGKLFMKLRVVSVFHNPKLSFAQSLSRSALWVLEILMFGIPMLEVLSHGLRRSLHDRASDTIVVTLKEQGDSGPHKIESQLVKQTLLAVFLVLITVGIFMTGNVYRMALAGDFAKVELAESKYLCQSISDRASRGDNRIDIAIALYQSETISAECLNAEADFAMWAVSEEQKAWAYYAKMLLSDDEEKKSAYQGKLCTLNSELCDLSNESLNKISNKSELKSSKTYAILKTKKDLYSSNVSEMEKDLSVLEVMGGFKDFAQSVQIKLFWLDDKKDQALGALDVVAHYMTDEQSQKISGWLCHQEMDNGCENKSYTSCNILKKQVGSKSKVSDSGSAFALIRESHCKKSALNYSQVEGVFSSDKTAFKLLRAIDSKSQLPENMRKAILLEMATVVSDKENVLSELAQSYAFEHELDRKDLKNLDKYLQKASVKNFAWQKLFVKTVKAAMKSNDKGTLRSLLTMVDLKTVVGAKQDFRDQMALAFYQIEDFKGSWAILKSSLPLSSTRAPASIDGRSPATADLLKMVRKELAQKFEGR